MDQLDMEISAAIISCSVSKPIERQCSSFVFNEALELVKRGINVHIIRPKIDKSDLIQGINFHGLEKKVDIRAVINTLRAFPVYSLNTFLKNPKMIYRDNRYAKRVSKIIKQKGLDLIHAHFAYSEGLVGLFSKRITKRPLIITVHGVDINTVPSIRYGIRLDKNMDKLVRRALKGADATITESRATFNEVKKIVGVGNEKKIHLISNGVDLNRFKPRKGNADIKNKLGLEEQTVIFILKSHEKVYGLEYMIKAIPLIIKEKSDVVFVFGGDGSLTNVYKELVSKLGVKEYVRFLGKIPHKETPHYYNLSDINVVPSLHEGFGLVVTEAMACGKPVVATRVGGILDQVIDGYNGFLIQPKSPIKIAEKILWLINNPKEGKRMGINGRKIVEEKFDINKKINKIISLYEALLHKHS